MFLAKSKAGQAWSLTLDYDYQFSDQLYAAGRKVDSPEETSTHVETLTLGHRFSDDWSAGLRLRWIHATHLGDHPELSLNGFGDIDLFGQWRLGHALAPGSWLDGLTLGAGLSLPTGDDAATPIDEAGILQLFQLGFGSVAPIASVSYSADLIGGLGFFAQSTAVFPTGESDLGIQYGSSVVSQIGLSYALAEDLRLRGSVDILWRDQSELQGRTLADTGGTTIALTPGLTWDVSDAWTLSAFLRIPVSQQLNGNHQLAPGIQAHIGLSYAF
jgi:hypothetical protein